MTAWLLDWDGVAGWTACHDAGAVLGVGLLLTALVVRRQGDRMGKNQKKRASARAGAHRELRPLIDAAAEQGWRVEMTRNQHVLFLGPRRGQRVVASLTPRNAGRAVKNTRALLRQNGLDL